MNQSLYNYLQANQMQQAQALSPLQMQSAPMPMPAAQQSSQGAYNPFDEGIRRTVSAARTSFAPTGEQNINKALERGLELMQ